MTSAFVQQATEEDFALLNACLAVENDWRREAWAALERVLMLCEFNDGTLAERVVALPDRTFAGAVLDLYELGWINTD